MGPGGAVEEACLALVEKTLHPNADTLGGQPKYLPGRHPGEATQKHGFDHFSSTNETQTGILMDVHFGSPQRLVGVVTQTVGEEPGGQLLSDTDAGWNNVLASHS